jgi:hypothetical protein
MPFIELNSKRLLFIHIPKTGGGSIESWLARHSPLYFYSDGVPISLKCTPQHLRMSDFRELFGDDYFTNALTIVRNPYTRIASEYRMRTLIQRSSFFKGHPTFSQWLQRSLEEARKNLHYLDNHIRPQWYYLDGDVEIYFYEKGLITAATKIASIIGIPLPKRLPRIHNTSAKGINVRLCLSDLLLINEYYKRDFELFGYVMYDAIPDPATIPDKHIADLFSLCRASNQLSMDRTASSPPGHSSSI